MGGTALGAGRLNRWIDIQQPKIVGNIQRWTLLAHVPAQIESASGAESARSGLEPLNVFSSILTIRYRADLAPKMRVKYDGRSLEIVSVSDPDGARRWIELNCRETQT